MGRDGKDPRRRKERYRSLCWRELRAQENGGRLVPFDAGREVSNTCG